MFSVTNNDDLDRYVNEHSAPEPALLQALARETYQKVVYRNMISGHLQGRLLSSISRMLQPKRVLELGTFTGYSALCLAEGMPPNAELHTIDINDEIDWLRKKYFEKSPHGGVIHQHIGKALEVVPTLPDAWDLVFIDADKKNYQAYYDLILPRVKPGGWMLLDNMLWYGKVARAETRTDAETKAIHALNAHVANDPSVDQVLLPIRDGLTLLQKIG